MSAQDAFCRCYPKQLAHVPHANSAQEGNKNSESDSAFQTVGKGQSYAIIRSNLIRPRNRSKAADHNANCSSSNQRNSKKYSSPYPRHNPKDLLAQHQKRLPIPDIVMQKDLLPNARIITSPKERRQHERSRHDVSNPPRRSFPATPPSPDDLIGGKNVVLGVRSSSVKD